MANIKLLHELQIVDSEIDKLKRTKETLPARARADELRQALTRAETELTAASGQLEAVTKEQRRLEDELDSLNKKIKHEEDRLYSGTIASPKELAGIQAEIKVLGKRRDDEETALLETIDRVEELAGAEVEFKRRVTVLKDELDRVAAELAKAESDIDALLARHEAEKTDLLAEIAPDALKLYDHLRHEKQGLAVTTLEGSTCGACHVELPAQDIDRLAEEDQLWRCPHCRRILVRHG